MLCITKITHTIFSYKTTIVNFGFCISVTPDSLIKKKDYTDTPKTNPVHFPNVIDIPLPSNKLLRHLTSSENVRY